ncbi:HNH endonuclease signature motif containing protein [Mycolicibacterium vaccae]|uniref:HNH nuclease domain-containing protein n=3 Tax=Mycolicibacterium vaccae TaxID=1810 RepID=K0UMJ0_MYCVA|nr:HNH endonuclease signature motif containing protein [Mycolicibacterium vaccae]ANI39349.1 hypothetical protein MYVA_2165 [Mycolicibacterium vaccae 95051]EJZ08382.1 hypothetical protein MVAC_15803 [Mycolicibacterium vaccae ATCC 25954]
MFDGSVPEPDQLAGLSDAELIDAAAVTSRMENAVCARKLALMAELFTRRVDLAPDDRLDWWVDPEAAVTAELAAAYRITHGLALHQAYRAVVLRDRLPKLGALFLQGLISEMLVRAIITRTDLIKDPDLIAAVDADLAADILGWGPLSVKKTEAEIDTIVERHDPDAVRKSREGDLGRTIEFGNPGDAPGFTTVWTRMFDGDAAAGKRTLTAMAYSVCDADPRTLDERREDALAALFHGITTLACRCGNGDCEAATNPRPVQEIIVYALTDHTTGQSKTSVEASASESETEEGTRPQPTPAPASTPRPSAPTLIPGRPGYIFGAGFMPAPFFDGLLGSAKIREVIHPDDSGPEPRYTPSRALAEFIRCRDLTCRFPGCDAPATLADIDHTVPYPLGPTHASNLKCLCRFHHLLKTFWTGATGWRDRQHPDGTVVWTAPTGHTYTTHPGSRLLFPALCAPTGILWTGDPPEPPLTDKRGAMMPKRRNTRAHNRARSIEAERRRNRRAHPPPRSDTPWGSATGWREPDYGDDPPPF